MGATVHGVRTSFQQDMDEFGTETFQVRRSNHGWFLQDFMSEFVGIDHGCSPARQGGGNQAFAAGYAPDDPQDQHRSLPEPTTLSVVTSTRQGFRRRAMTS